MPWVRNVCTAVSNKRGMCCIDDSEVLPPVSEYGGARCLYCFGPVFDRLRSDNPEHNEKGLTAAVTQPPAPAVQTRLLQGTSAERKEFPMCEGLLDYFPDACAEVSRVSFLGNEKHNPGEPMHHARGKSGDHANCIARHLTERGGFDTVVIGGVERQVRHSAALAWRALALCQEEIEHEMGYPLPRGAKSG